MIISHKHKFIFLHCRKVAGSSITSLLNPYLGPNDIQVGAWIESIKSGGRYNKLAIHNSFINKDGRKKFTKNFLKSFAQRRWPQFSQMVNQSAKAAYRSELSGNLTHATASQLMKFAPSAWKDYYKFCFVRNPYEQAVSDYFWRNRARYDISFVEFMRRKLDPHRPDLEGLVPTPVTNWEIYTINDEIVVDFIGRYENLTEDLSKIGENLSLNLDLSLLSNSKSGYRKGDYRKIYSEEAKELVEKVYRKEIEYFQYNFNG